MNYKEITVTNAGQMKDGDMKKIVVDDGMTILLSRIDGTYYAIGGCCTHYDAPLDEGILSGEHVVCPWHHAVFNAISGMNEEPPALDDVPRYEVSSEDGVVKIKIPEKKEEHHTGRKITFDPEKDDRTFMIIGGGAAGDSAAAALRHNGFMGKIVMIGNDSRLPYDRTSLNKAYLRGLSGEESLPLRPKDFYDRYGIEPTLKKEITAIDKNAFTVTADTGESYEYDRLLIATGGRPKTLDIPGAGLENIFTLRSFDDARKIKNTGEEAKHAVIVGASFIGLESAFSLTERGCKVTVVAPEAIPFAPLFGEETGTMFKNLHEERGVIFRLGAAVDSFEGDGRVEKAILNSGEEILADMVLIGIGIVPNTDFLDGFDKSDRGGIVVDRYLCAAENIYAAGDIAQFPHWKTGESMRIEHWRTAQQLGACAAANMLGKETPFRGVPFFWSSQLGLHFRYTGHARSWDDIHVKGDIRSQDFTAFYVKNGVVEAVSGINRDREIVAAEELFRTGRMPDIHALSNKSFDIVSFLYPSLTVNGCFWGIF